MWGFAQIKYANGNVWSRGVVSLHSSGWVHLITYPLEAQEELIMMTFPANQVEQLQWLEVKLSPLDKEGNGIGAAKAVLDKYRDALYPQVEGVEGSQAPQAEAAPTA
ncbi:MAG: hypothetical protein VKS61_09495 [Candidatus Sericytochromatia bacterium]|nr:hypothetical protein [Candidatus Sericytochromatia bacterium]